MAPKSTNLVHLPSPNMTFCLNQRRFFAIKKVTRPLSSSSDTGCLQIYLFRPKSCRIFPIILFPYITPSLIPTTSSLVTFSYDTRSPLFKQSLLKVLHWDSLSSLLVHKAHETLQFSCKLMAWFSVNLLNTKRILLYIRNQSVPRSKHFPPRL